MHCPEGAARVNLTGKRSCETEKGSLAQPFSGTHLERLVVPATVVCYSVYAWFCNENMSRHARLYLRVGNDSKHRSDLQAIGRVNDIFYLGGIVRAGLTKNPPVHLSY